jgi:hypothetical protein
VVDVPKQQDRRLAHERIQRHLALVGLDAAAVEPAPPEVGHADQIGALEDRDRDAQRGTEISEREGLLRARAVEIDPAGEQPQDGPDVVPDAAIERRDEVRVLRSVGVAGAQDCGRNLAGHRFGVHPSAELPRRRRKDGRRAVGRR